MRKKNLAAATSYYFRVRPEGVTGPLLCSGSEAGSYVRLTDSCITQLKAQGPCRTCNESKEEEEEDFRVRPEGVPGPFFNPQ